MLNKTIYPSLLKLINSNNVINSSLKTIREMLEKMQKLSAKLSKLILGFDTSDYTDENTSSSNKITETIDEIRLCFDTIEPLLPKEFEPFIVEERTDGDQTITFYATRPSILENGRIILR